MYLPLSPSVLHGRMTNFFYHQKKTILKSPFPVLKNFMWGTLHLRLSQRCVVRLYVTHNPVYVMFTATLHRTTRDKTSKGKVFSGKLAMEHILFYFLNIFQLFFELEKKSSLGTSAFSAKSCTSDTDRPFLHEANASTVALVQDLAEKALVPKLDSSSK